MNSRLILKTAFQNTLDYPEYAPFKNYPHLTLPFLEAERVRDSSIRELFSNCDIKYIGLFKQPQDFKMKINPKDLPVKQAVDMFQIYLNSIPPSKS